ncbi:hypothetical protein PRIPAC_90163, partial [Pristionchus pacificus]|uniref:Uncharacterized protein n=1 Tax=Pristionchus pacificus TaxID=54126 RepID=A0A2A6B7B5_PRIPA
MLPPSHCLSSLYFLVSLKSDSTRACCSVASGGQRYPRTECTRIVHHSDLTSPLIPNYITCRYDAALRLGQADMRQQWSRSMSTVPDWMRARSELHGSIGNEEGPIRIIKTIHFDNHVSYGWVGSLPEKVECASKSAQPPKLSLPPHSTALPVQHLAPPISRRTTLLVDGVTEQLRLDWFRLVSVRGTSNDLECIGDISVFAGDLEPEEEIGQFHRITGSLDDGREEEGEGDDTLSDNLQKAEGYQKRGVWCDFEPRSACDVHRYSLVILVIEKNNKDKTSNEEIIEIPRARESRTKENCSPRKQPNKVTREKVKIYLNKCDMIKRAANVIITMVVATTEDFGKACSILLYAVDAQRQFEEFNKNSDRVEYARCESAKGAAENAVERAKEYVNTASEDHPNASIIFRRERAKAVKILREKKRAHILG